MELLLYTKKKKSGEGIWRRGARRGVWCVRNARLGSGSFFMQPFWAITPLEADAVDFSPNNRCLSASLHHPAVQAGEVRLEGRARIREPSPFHPGLGALVTTLLGLGHLLRPWRALQSLPTAVSPQPQASPSGVGTSLSL